MTLDHRCVRSFVHFSLVFYEHDLKETAKMLQLNQENKRGILSFPLLFVPNIILFHKLKGPLQ